MKIELMFILVNERAAGGYPGGFFMFKGMILR